MYNIKCKLCNKKKQTRYKNQQFCSKKCAGKSNIKKRIYKTKKHSKQTKYRQVISAGNTISIDSAVLCGAINNSYRAPRRILKKPENEYELYECIKTNDLISKPFMIKVIKTMKTYQKHLKKA